MNTIAPDSTLIAFADAERIARGSIAEVALATKPLVDAHDPRRLLIFDATTSYPVEIDFRGSSEEMLARLPQVTPQPAPEEPRPEPTADQPEQHAAGTAPRGPGRPKLGVVAREVTLLPRHWEWLASQPGGASVTLRKLVETARRENAEADRLRKARDATYRFMLAIAGDEPGFEEAMRALYADDSVTFGALVEVWPPDVRDHVLELSSAGFSANLG